MATEKTALLGGKCAGGEVGKKQQMYVRLPSVIVTTYGDDSNPIVVEMPPQIDGEFNDKCGALTLQQIARYADDPWWRNLRRGLMISVWMSMALMILAAVLIAIVEHEQVCVAGKSMVTPFGSPSMAPPWHVSDRRDDDAPTSSSSSAAAVAAATLSFVPADVIQASGGSTAAAIATATATAAAGNGL